MVYKIKLVEVVQEIEAETYDDLIKELKKLEPIRGKVLWFGEGQSMIIQVEGGERNGV